MAADHKIAVKLKKGEPSAPRVSVTRRSNKVVLEWEVKDRRIRRILGICFDDAAKCVFDLVGPENEEMTVWSAINRAKDHPRGVFSYQIKVELADGTIVGRDPEVENNVPPVSVRLLR